MKVKKRKSHRTKRKTTKVKRKRRNAVLTSPRRRRRRNPGIKKTNVISSLTSGAMAALGAGGILFASNMIKKQMADSGKALSIPMSNFVTLGLAVAFSALLPKLKLGKHSDAIATGAIGISMLNIASNSLGAKEFLSLSGEDNPELDRIIANLNVDGFDDDDDFLLGEDIDLLGDSIPLMGISESDNNLLGIAESLSGYGEMLDEEDYF